MPIHSLPRYMASMQGGCRQTTMLVDTVQPQIMEAIIIMNRERHMQQATVCTRRRRKRM